MEAVLEIQSRQLSNKHNPLFGLEDTIVRRGKKQRYTLAPADEEDDFFSPELEVKIESALQQYKEGKYTRCSTYEDSLKFFESL